MALRINQNREALDAYRNTLALQSQTLKGVEPFSAGASSHRPDREASIQAMAGQAPVQDSVNVGAQAASTQGGPGATAPVDPSTAPTPASQKDLADLMAFVKVGTDLSRITVRTEHPGAPPIERGTQEQLTNARAATEDNRMLAYRTLQQAGTSSLQQANALPQAALNLLG